MSKKLSSPPRRFIAAIALMLPALAHSAEAPAEWQPQQLPQRIDALRAQTLSISREAQAVEEQLVPGAGPNAHADDAIRGSARRDWGTDAITHYNEAVASIAEGKAAQGIAILEEMGRSDAADSGSLALRDQANITLGYYYLRQREGQSAIPVFSRVRAVGPYASRGLLGLGWAFLAPPGAAQKSAEGPRPDQPDSQRIGVVLRPRLTADIAKLRRDLPFRLRQATGENELALRRALVPWVELTGRDPTDPAVQEGMLAIAYSLNHLGAYEEARERYVKIVDLLEQVRGWFDQAIAHVGSGRMAAIIKAGGGDSYWPWWVTDLPVRHWWLAELPGVPMPKAPDTFYFERLLADGEFQDAAQDYRDLNLFDSVLDAHARQLASPTQLASAATAATDATESHAYDPRVEELRGRIDVLRLRAQAEGDAQRQQLEDIAIAKLRRQKQQTEQYLAEARFVLARIYDRPPEGEYK